MNASNNKTEKSPSFFLSFLILFFSSSMSVFFFFGLLNLEDNYLKQKKGKILCYSDTGLERQYMMDWHLSDMYLRVIRIQYISNTPAGVSIIFNYF